MIIWKPQPTPEQQAQLDEIYKEMRECAGKYTGYFDSKRAEIDALEAADNHEAAEKIRARLRKKRADFNSEIKALSDKELEIGLEMDKAYIDKFNKNKAALLADAKEILNALTKDDFIDYIQRFNISRDLTKFVNEATEKGELEPWQILQHEAYFTERYKAFYMFSLHPLRIHLKALDEWAESSEELLDLAARRAGEFYPEEPLEFPKVTTTRGELPEALENQQSKQPKNVIEPLSKLNTGVALFDWLNRENALPGQISIIPVKMEADKDTRELTMNVSISYPEGVVKNLSPTDNRIYNATAWLYAENGQDMTYSQIARAAGWKKPNATQLDKIRASVEKMRLISIEWDNKAEAKAYGKNTEYITYTGYLYPAELIDRRKTFNGKIAEGYVRVLRPLPLMEFAKERGEIATIPAAILESKVSMTDENIAMQDYIIRRIERKRRTIKTGQAEEKIIYDTLYKNAGANTRQKKRSMIKNLYKYLEELREKGYISAYKEEATKSTGAVGVVISFGKKKLKEEGEEKKNH